MACSPPLIGGGTPESPFCLAAAPEAGFAGAAGVHAEHQGGGHRLQLACFQGLAEGVESLGAKPAGAAVVGERQQGRLTVHRQCVVDGDAVTQPPPVVLKPAPQKGIGLNHGCCPSRWSRARPRSRDRVGREPAALELSH